MNEILYHISRNPLKINTILHKGNYGKSQIKGTFDEEQIEKEELFEEVRKKISPKAPSRLDCIFLFNDLITAKLYRAYRHKYFSYIYEIEILNGTPYQVDQIWLDCNGLEVFKKEVFAKYYWLQVWDAASITKETLLNGNIIIKKEIEKPIFLYRNTVINEP